jgi:hypothetical protein
MSCKCKRGLRGYSGTNGYSYIEVPLSSEQILELGSNPLAVLPAAGVNTYYQYVAILEFSVGEDLYTFENDYLNFSNSIISPNLISGDVNSVVEVSSISSYLINVSDEVSINEPKNLNEPIFFFTNGGTNPTLGNGTILIKLWYKVRTFGSEL